MSSKALLQQAFGSKPIFLFNINLLHYTISPFNPICCPRTKVVSIEIASAYPQISIALGLMLKEMTNDSLSLIVHKSA